MPMVSRAQARMFRAVEHNPALGKQLGVSQDTAKKFIADSHGQKVRDLPERVKKACGGAVKPAGSLAKGW